MFSIKQLFYIVFTIHVASGVAHGFGLLEPTVIGAVLSHFLLAFCFYVMHDQTVTIGALFKLSKAQRNIINAMTKDQQND